MNWLTGQTTNLTAEQYSAVYASLSPSRKAHIDRMKKEEARRCSLMATHLLNQLVLKELGRSVPIEMHENGKPYLKGCNLFVSISHSFDMVACAISAEPIGIDIEKIRPVSRKLVEYVCTESEREYVLKNNEPDDVNRRFFKVWTAKEARFKKGGDVAGLRPIETLSLKKQVFISGDYIITII